MAIVLIEFVFVLINQVIKNAGLRSYMELKRLFNEAITVMIGGKIALS